MTSGVTNVPRGLPLHRAGAALWVSRTRRRPRARHDHSGSGGSAVRAWRVVQRGIRGMPQAAVARETFSDFASLITETTHKLMAQGAIP